MKREARIWACVVRAAAVGFPQFFESVPADVAGTSLRRRESRENRERLRHCNG